MNIITLANVYDTVYTLKNNKVVETTVTYISIEVLMKDKDLMSTKTIIKYRTDHGLFPADAVFSTKQALLDSL